MKNRTTYSLISQGISYTVHPTVIRYKIIRYKIIFTLLDLSDPCKLKCQKIEKNNHSISINSSRNNHGLGLDMHVMNTLKNLALTCLNET